MSMFVFLYDFQIFARSGVSTHFVLLFKNSRDSSANDVYASGPEIPPRLEKNAFCFSFILPPYCPSCFQFCHFAPWWRTFGSRPCVSSSCTTSHFISSMQSGRRGSKTASLALSCSSCVLFSPQLHFLFSNIFFPVCLHTSSKKNLSFKSWWHMMLLFVFLFSVRNARSYMIMW